jgi:hypothetical protein
MNEEKCQFAPEILAADSRKDDKGPEQGICFVVNETTMKVYFHCLRLFKGDGNCNWKDESCEKIEYFEKKGFEVFECERSFLHYVEPK